MALNLAATVRNAPAGATLRLPPGRYEVNLVIEKPIVLLGVGLVVFDGTHRGSVVRINCPHGVVKLAGLTLVGGAAPDAGGGICLLKGELEMKECIVRFNKAPLYGGGGLFLRAGHARIQRCRFEANTGRQGGGILVDELAGLAMRDSTLIQNAAVMGGGVTVKDGSRAQLLGCTIADNKVVGDGAQGGAIALSGSSTREPEMTLAQCIVSERAPGSSCVFNESPYPGRLALQRNLLPPWCAPLGGDNLFADAGFIGAGNEPYLLRSNSAAAGAGNASAFGDGAKDLLGHLRGPTPSLGAFGTPVKFAKDLPY